ncbi:MAG: NnrS family protein [Bdellovibrionota bacterium]
MLQTPFFSIGFRSFFLAATCIAILSPTYWVSVYFNYISYHGTLLPPVSWHSHEMIFGFVPAMFSGFLLTASSHWTGQLPIKGKVLATLFALWCLERIIFLLPIPPLSQMILSMSFLLTLTVVLGVYLRQSVKQQLIFTTFLSGFMIAKFIMLLGAYQKSVLLYIGQDMGLALIRLLILLIASRVLPFFINSRFKPEIKIECPKAANLAVIGSALFLLVLIPFNWLSMPSVGIPLYALAAIAVFLQFLYYKPWYSGKEPMIAILLIGHLWIFFHYILEIVVLFDSSKAFAHPHLHALSAGAIGCMGIGIMSRVTLGHTGRKITADKWTKFAFLCVIIGAVVRVLVPILSPKNFLSSVHHASGWWTLGYLIFLIRYMKYWLQPRL